MHSVHGVPIGVLGNIISSEWLRTVEMRGEGVAVETDGPVHPFQGTTFFETGKGILQIHSLRPARFKLQTQLAGRLEGQTGEYGVDLAPQTTIDVLLRAHIRAIVVKIESDGCKARGVDRLEQGGEETVKLCASRVVRKKCQFSEVCEPEILEEVGVVGCPQSA